MVKGGMVKGRRDQGKRADRKGGRGVPGRAASKPSLFVSLRRLLAQAGAS
jgi:hypothetical protein